MQKTSALCSVSDLTFLSASHSWLALPDGPKAHEKRSGQRENPAAKGKAQTNFQLSGPSLFALVVTLKRER